MIELIIKIVITVLLVVVGAKALYWTWTSQIDPRATLYKYIKKEPKIADMVVARDQDKLYQNGVAVADVTGTVQIDGTVLFTQLVNVVGLDRSQPIEYRRHKLRVTQVQYIAASKIVMTVNGTSVLKNVMEGVTCEELK